MVFGSLLKKDDTTKEKALGELLDWVNSHEQIEDAVVNCFTQLYPRLSFENSLRIRTSGHKILGLIAAKTRKGILKYLTGVAGSWLAGLYDGDKTVRNAAAESLRLAFTTDEKIGMVWRSYASNILEFCDGVVKGEKVETLSDERSSGRDEMEGKFARVMAGCTLAVGHLVCMANFPVE